MSRPGSKADAGKPGSTLVVRVTPRASRSRIVEVMANGTVKIHIAAPPVGGAANEKLVAFLSQILDISKSRVKIVAGISGRNKLIAVSGLDAATVQARLAAQLR